MNNLSYIGVDVSKAHLDVASDLAAQRHPNHPTAIAAWLKKLPPQGHLIVEATGGFPAPLVPASPRAGPPIPVSNPPPVCSFPPTPGAPAHADATQPPPPPAVCPAPTTLPST